MVVANDKKAPAGAMVIKVSLDKILPNPYQPPGRINIDKAIAEHFGQSILQHGMIQIPIARERPGEPGFYEMGDGWLRRSGYAWLRDNNNGAQYHEMPLQVLTLTDREMADLVDVTQERQDLTPIDRAHYYKQYLNEFKVTQQQLADSHGCSQGQIANTIRLLELPETMQQAVISQEITPAHARQLLRLAGKPDEMANSFQLCRTGKTVAALSLVIDNQLFSLSRSLNPTAPEWKFPPLFDLTDCAKCPDAEMFSPPWAGGRKEPRCTRTECWHQKQDQAVMARAATCKEDLQKQGITDFITGSAVDARYQRLDEWSLRLVDNPGECGQCAKRAAMLQANRHPLLLCADKLCYNAKRLKKAGAEQAERCMQQKKEEERLKRVISKIALGTPDAATALRAALLVLLPNDINNVADDMANICGLPLDPDADDDEYRKAFKGYLESRVLPELASLVVAYSVCCCNDFGDADHLAEVMDTLEGKARKKSAAELPTNL